MATGFARREQGRVKGSSLFMGGDEFAAAMDDQGNRAVAVTDPQTGDQRTYDLGQSRGQMRSSVMPVEEFGKRELKPGEFEAVVPASVDRNGNGIPDGAEVKLTATWRQGAGRSVMETPPGSMVSQEDTRAAEGVLRDQAMDQRARLQEMRETSPFSRNTVGGVTLPERRRAENERAAVDGRMTERALGVADRQFVAPAREETRRFEAGLEANRNQRVEFVEDPVSKRRFARMGNTLLPVETRQDGFFELRGVHGETQGVFSADGDVVTFDPKSGKPVIDRAPRVPRSVSGGGAGGLLDGLLSGGGDGAGGMSVVDPVANVPPVQGARQARDGKWYLQRDGVWYAVE